MVADADDDQVGSKSAEISQSLIIINLVTIKYLGLDDNKLITTNCKILHHIPVITQHLKVTLRPHVIYLSLNLSHLKTEKGLKSMFPQ